MQTDTVSKNGSLPLLAMRSAIGGVLMGLANLVPGISGGTMLLAAGVYTFFIDAIAEITTLRFRLRSIVVLGAVAVAAALAILLLAGTVKDLVVNYRWVMYSVFIGLTLGGGPIVWRMIGSQSKSMWGGAVAGFVAMGILAIFQQQQMGAEGGASSNVFMLGLAGMAGASAMILPGVSGGYLLLVLGQYVPILSAIDTLKEGLKVRDMAAVMDIGLEVCVPVGIGVVIGVVGVSNLLRILLKRCEKATLGVLLGLLLGAVVGLWPFQKGEEPAVGDVVKGHLVSVETLSEIDPEDYPIVYFKPSTGVAGASILLILMGFGITLGISRLGGEE